MDDATLRRLEKLVRLAESTHSDAERKSALKECVRLLDAKGKRAGMEPRAYAYSPPPAPAPVWHDWHTIIAAAPGNCCMCQRRYYAGESLWWRSSDNAIIHGDCW